MPPLYTHLALEQGHLRRDVLRLALLPEVALPELAEPERGDGAAPSRTGPRPVDGPLLRRQRWEVERLDRDGLLRVREQVVAVHEDGVAPLVGEVERELDELDALAHVLRCEHEVAVVAVPTSTSGLEVVAL